MSNPIDVLVPADTRFTYLLAQHSAQIKTPVFLLASYEQIRQLANKGTFAEFLLKHQLPLPNTILIHHPADVETLASDLDFPVMIKPPQGEGGQGVQQVATLDELRQKVEQQPMPLLIQEWIPGMDIDLSLIANQGEILAWSIQHSEGEGMRFVEHPEVIRIGQEICRASEYHGVAYVDMRIDDRTGQVNVIEFNPRFWRTLLYSTWMGINFLALGVGMARGETDALKFQPVIGYCQCPYPTASTLIAWICNRFQPPDEWRSRQDGWWNQMLDPMPEWLVTFVPHSQYSE